MHNTQTIYCSQESLTVSVYVYLFSRCGKIGCIFLPAPSYVSVTKKTIPCHCLCKIQIYVLEKVYYKTLLDREGK